MMAFSGPGRSLPRVAMLFVVWCATSLVSSLFFSSFVTEPPSTITTEGNLRSSSLSLWVPSTGIVNTNVEITHEEFSPAIHNETNSHQVTSLIRSLTLDSRIRSSERVKADPSAHVEAPPPKPLPESIRLLRIPKAGSSSFSAFLRIQYQCITKEFPPGDCTSLNQKACPAVKGCTDHQPPPSSGMRPLVTVFRDPVERYISAYHYPNHHGRGTRGNIILHTVMFPEWNNTMTTYMSGHVVGTWDERNGTGNNKRYKPPTPETNQRVPTPAQVEERLRRATQLVNNPSRMMFTGLLEFWSDSLRLFCRMYQCPDLDAALLARAERKNTMEKLGLLKPASSIQEKSRIILGQQKKSTSSSDWSKQRPGTSSRGTVDADEDIAFLRQFYKDKSKFKYPSSSSAHYARRLSTDDTATTAANHTPAALIVKPPQPSSNSVWISPAARKTYPYSFPRVMNVIRQANRADLVLYQVAARRFCRDLARYAADAVFWQSLTGPVKVFCYGDHQYREGDDLLKVHPLRVDSAVLLYRQAQVALSAQKIYPAPMQLLYPPKPGSSSSSSSSSKVTATSSSSRRVQNQK